MLFLVLPVLVVALVWIGWRVKHRKLVQMSRGVPGPRSLPLLGDALAVMVPPEELTNKVEELRQQYGDFFRIWLGPDLNYFVSDPDDVKTLLSSMKTTTKGPQYKYMVHFIGEGILSGSGPVWRRRRKTATPNYGKKAIESYSQTFNNEINILVDLLRTKSNGESFDIFNDVIKTTTYCVCQTLMGLTREQTLNLPHLQDIMMESHELYAMIFRRMTTWYLQIDPIYWFTKFHKLQVRFQKMIREISDVIVKHRLEVLENMDNVKKIELLHLEGDDKNNTELSVIDRFILSKNIPNYDDLLKETFTIFTSSQEATAKISSFLLLMMAYHPECQDRLYQEIKGVLGGGDRDVTDAEIKQMSYLEMVFKEVLRLFPIGVMLQRTVTEDIKISHGVLPAGCSLVVPMFHMHRDKRFWKDPNAFDPERFTPENIKLRNPNCYIPFSLGPMDCLGRYFGTKLIKTLCVKVMREFKLSSPETYDDMKIVMAVSATSVNGYPIILTPRKNLV